MSLPSGVVGYISAAYEIDSVIQRHIDLFICVLRRVLRTPCHRSMAYFTDLDFEMAGCCIASNSAIYGDSALEPLNMAAGLVE